MSDVLEKNIAYLKGLLVTCDNFEERGGTEIKSFQLAYKCWLEVN